MTGLLTNLISKREGGEMNLEEIGRKDGKTVNLQRTAYKNCLIILLNFFLFSF